jgi:hypothetical protein
MIILKHAGLTCFFYLAIALLIEAGISIWIRVGKGGMIGLRGLPFVVLFGIIWLLSFSIAWRIVAIRPPH